MFIDNAAPPSDSPESPGVRSASGGFQYQIDGSRKALPIGGLFDELLAPGRSQLVELGLAVVLRSAPLRTDPSLLLQTIERRIKRALLHSQSLFGHLADQHRDSEPVHRAELKRLEDKHIECSL